MGIKKICIAIVILLLLGLCSCGNGNSTITDSVVDGGSSESNVILEYVSREYSGVIVLKDGRFYFQNINEGIFAEIKENTVISRLFTDEKASISDLKDGLLSFADIVVEINSSFTGDYSLGDVAALRINN